MCDKELLELDQNIENLLHHNALPHKTVAIGEFLAKKRIHYPIFAKFAIIRLFHIPKNKNGNKRNTVRCY